MVSRVRTLPFSALGCQVLAFGETTAHFQDQTGTNRLASGSWAVECRDRKHSGTDSQKEQSLSVGCGFSCQKIWDPSGLWMRCWVSAGRTFVVSDTTMVSALSVCTRVS